MEDRVDDDTTLKKRLLGRILFAVLVLAALIGSLVAYDHVNAPVAPEPVVVAKRAEPPAVAAIPATDPPAAPVDLIKSAEPDGAGKVAEAGKVAVDAVPEESASPKAVAESKPLTRPATAKHALMRDSDATSRRPASPPSGALAASREASAPPTQPARQAGTPVRPVSSQTKPFSLQLGVFSDVANAEELRSRLEKAGVRASIEARVHVGPFATRAEADAARAKLRELGIADAILLSRGAR